MKKITPVFVAIVLLAAPLLVGSTQAAPGPVPLRGGTTNLIAWWSMDETSGTRFDSHGTNALSDNGNVGTTTGVVGNAASFDGLDDYLSIADNLALSTGDIDWSTKRI
jgi:hypothetical protein